MLVYKLNQQIDGTKLIQNIEKEVQKSISPNKEYLLIIKVQEIVYNDDSSIPKIEYKPE